MDDSGKKLQNGVSTELRSRKGGRDIRKSLDEEEEENDQIDTPEETESSLNYGLLDIPPIPITLMAALQHILLSISGCLSVSSVVADVACMPYDHEARSQLFCSTIFMVGLCSILQTALGVRLPIFQGPSSSFLVPLLTLQRDVTWKCQADLGKIGPYNTTTNSTEVDHWPEIKWRLQEMSGALMVASLVEVLLGCTGLLTYLLRFIGPITIAVTISLIGTSLYKLPVTYGRPNYYIALGTLALTMLFTLYMEKVTIPLPRIGKARNEKKRPSIQIFQLLPVLLGIVAMWALTWILTVCNVFTHDKTDITYMARADAKINIIERSDWFFITYPGQFGAPKLSLALTIGFLVAFISSAVESVGDYHAAYKACNLPVLPRHAVARGILMEGLGSVISGSVGTGHATTSYSGNIAIITLTKTGSRIVMYTASVILIVLSLFGKAGAALTTIPDPVLSGVLVFTCGTLISIGLANLKHVDMTNSRNLLVVGIPLLLGLVIPEMIETYPEVIQTGMYDLDRVLLVMLGTPMFIGGMLALFLDATAPGTKEIRGMLPSADSHTGGSEDTSMEAEMSTLYSWFFYPRLAKLCPCVTYLPFMPKVSKIVESDIPNASHDVKKNVNYSENTGLDVEKNVKHYDNAGFEDEKNVQISTRV